MMPWTSQERRVVLFLASSAAVGALVIGYQRTVGARQTPLEPVVEAASWDAALGRLASARSVSLNRATVEELSWLPGIGPSLAAQIVEYRQEHGSFLRVDDLEAVSGIGPKMVERLRGKVTVDR